MVIKEEKTNPQNKNGNPEIPLNPKSPGTEGSKKHRIKNTEKLSNIKEPDWIKIIRKWLIVIFTGFMTYYTAKLFFLTTEQAKDASETAKRALAINEAISNTQEKFVIYETRAYVSIANFTYSYNEGSKIEINFDICNTGKMPANHLFESTVITTENKLDSAAIVLRGVINRRENIGITLSSNGISKKYVTSDWNLSSSDFRKIAPGYYIIGLIKYDDRWGKIRHTWFCYNINTSGEIIAYKKYNEAD